MASKSELSQFSLSLALHSIVDRTTVEIGPSGSNEPLPSGSNSSAMHLINRAPSRAHVKAILSCRPIVTI